MNESWKPYLGRLIFTVLGFITAILFMTLGFAKTMLILICCGIGYIVGAYKDKCLHFKGFNFSELPRLRRNKR